MALTLPTSADLYAFWGDDADESDAVRSDLLIQLSADLFWLATGMEDDPTDARLARLVKYAILDVAIYLYATREEIDNTYSPYVSERIGSYSYSKTYSKISRSVASGDSTGIEFFDRVVQYLTEQAMYADSGSMVAESVFHTGYQPLWKQSMGLGRMFGDPNGDLISRSVLYSYFGNADDDEGFYANGPY